MSLSLLPTWIAGTVTDLTPELLERRGIRLLMLDFDNTIVPYTTDVPERKMTQWLERMRESGIALCVVSNSRKPRVTAFCEKWGLPCINRALKPFPRGIRACLTRFGYPAAECALVGDQIFTDTLGANAAGVQSILVSAINNHNIWLKLRHVAEMPFIFLARKRRIKS